MKTGNLLFSAVQFIFVVLILVAGLLFIVLPYSPHLRAAITHFFSQGSAVFSLVGFLTLVCGSLLLLGFYAMYRGSYYTVRMGKNELFVDPAVIHSYVEEYWKSVFPNQDLSIEIDLSKNQTIEMFVEMPMLAPENQHSILEKAEVDLSQILQKHLGYRREFLISVLVK